MWWFEWKWAPKAPMCDYLAPSCGTVREGLRGVAFLEEVSVLQQNLFFYKSCYLCHGLSSQQQNSR